MNELLSAFGIDWRLLLAQAINFAIVLVALRYFLYRPLIDFLARRQELAAKSVADAEKAAELLAGADAVAQRRVTTAESEAEAIVSSARDAGTAEKTRLLKEAEERALAVASDAEARAKEVAARERRESEQDIARVALLAAEKILRKNYD